MDPIASHTSVSVEVHKRKLWVQLISRAPYNCLNKMQKSSIIVSVAFSSA